MTTPDRGQEPAPENVGDRLVLIETAVAYLVERDRNITQLSNATDRLAEGTEGVEAALRAVNEVKAEQRQQQEALDTVAPIAAQAATRHEVYRRLVLLWLFIGLVVVAAVFSLIDRHNLHRDVHRNKVLICQLEHRLGTPCQ